MVKEAEIDESMLKPFRYGPSDFVITLDSGTKIYIKVEEGEPSNGLSNKARLAEMGIQAIRETDALGQTRNRIGFTISNGLGILSYVDGETRRIVELSGDYEITLCKELFREPTRIFNETDIFDEFKRMKKEKRQEVFNPKPRDEQPEAELKRQVRAATERVNKKVKNGLGLEQIVVYRAGSLQINENYLTE